jgi:hypothetical protein
MARYGDIVEVLKIEVKLVRGAKESAKCSLVLPLMRSATKPASSLMASITPPLVSALAAPAAAPEADAGIVLVGDTSGLIELLGDEREFRDVVELCARVVAKQLERRSRAV